MTNPPARLPQDGLEARIFLIRASRVMIDRDLAALYGVTTKVLNQAVKRNRDRFPAGFMFRLTPSEARELVTNCDRFASLKHAAGAPFAFTEYGVAMLSSVLRSRRAVKTNVAIIQAFIRLRRLALTNEEFTTRLAALEERADLQDGRIREVFEAMRRLIRGPQKPRPAIGFRP